MADLNVPVLIVGDSIYKVTSLGGDGELDGRTLFTLDSFGGGGLENKYSEDSPRLSSKHPQIRLEPAHDVAREDLAAAFAAILSAQVRT